MKKPMLARATPMMGVIKYSVANGLSMPSCFFWSRICQSAQGRAGARGAQGRARGVGVGGVARAGGERGHEMGAIGIEASTRPSLS